ncbi:LysR substrate-binding domain-containing protein (plasmid) [Roseomonas gilardii subsp. gilardii]|nr:LysR substrate-binding domain-containing protein [Roseomonas gilardii]UPG74785.1 LysR substrate-binding domain-containing protein [Roseomonas gilardii subsp. gilardii]
MVGQLYPPDKPDGLLREALYEEPISVLARTDHPVFETPITAEALRRWELVLPTIGQRVGQEIDQLLVTLGLTPTTSMRSTSYGFIREMLHSTDFISVMPNTMMAGDLLRGTIRAAPLPAASRPRPAGFIRRADTPLSPAAEVLVEGLRRYVEEIAARGERPGRDGEPAGSEGSYVGRS